MKKYLYIFLSIISTILVVITSVSADNIVVNGLSANDAIITDTNGNIINHNQNLSQWDSYQIEYHWSIPNDVQVKKGDSTDFQIPNNVVVQEQEHFNIYDQNGNIVGYVDIPANSSTGKITFTNEISNQINRKGTIKFWAKGKKETAIPDEFATKGGKINNNGEITWNIILNKKGETLNNIQIVDTIQNNMRLNSDSIHIYSGKIENGQFISTGSITPDNLDITGSTINIKINQITSPIEIVYTVKHNQGTDFYNEVGISANGNKYNAYAHVLTGGIGSENGENPFNSSSSLSSSKNNIYSSSSLNSSKNNIYSSSSLSSSKNNIYSSSSLSNSKNNIYSSSSLSKSKNNKLPQTGEDINNSLFILGISILFIISGYLILTKKK